MREETKILELDGEMKKVKLLHINEEDRPLLQRIYDLWRELSEATHQMGGRRINIPDALSEGAFCLEFGENMCKSISGGSFDVINLENNSRIQVKACSVESDLTSFGPKSVWDEIYFLDFYRDGNFDRTFDVYRLENDDVYGQQVNRDQTFADQQGQTRRPRFSIKSCIIGPRNLRPLRTCRI